MKRTRSRAYPAIALQDAYQILRESLGILGPHGKKRQEIAALLGYSSTSGGLGVRKIAALANYGLLEKRGDVYTLSAFGGYLRGLEPQGRDWAAAISSAFHKPSLFEDLVLTYRACGRIPNNLPEVLEEHFQIAHNASKMAARIFLKSGQFAGALDGHSILPTGTPVGIEKLESHASATSALPEDPPAESSQSASAQFKLSGRKRAFFSLELPDELADEDYLRIQQHLTYWASHFASFRHSDTVEETREPLPFRGKKGLSRNT